MMAGKQLFAIPVDQTGESTRLVRTAIFVIVFFVGGAAAWGALAPISGAVVARGIVKIDTSTKSVQHLEGGIIREILVREGDYVEKGQPLITLEDTDARASLNILTDALNAHLAKEARLVAEASLKETMELPPALTQDPSENTRALIHNEQAIFRAKRKTLLDQIELIDDQVTFEGEAGASLESQIAATEEGLDYVLEQLKAGEQLTERRALDRNSLLDLKRKLTTEKQSLFEQKAELAVRRQNMAALKLQIVNLRNDYSKTAENELKDTRQLIFEAREKIRPVLDTLQRRTIRATVAGQVIKLRATTIGGVIKPGETVLDLVPKARDLIFEVEIWPRDADSVHLGQAAKIQLSAFNQRTTPLADGILTYVSGDAIIQDNNQELPHYLAHIKADPDSLSLPADRELTPGMPVVAFLQTEPRTFFQYVLSPITAGMRKALVEEIH
jgi:HlyD family secretion protein/epimerase transport system membrane fusion protein